MLAPVPYALATLSVSLLFAAIFLFGGRVHRPGHAGRRRFLSFAAGISVGYTFVHVLPALGRIQGIVARSPDALGAPFPEHSVYLWAMAGFMVFYGLETMTARSARTAEGAAGEDAAAPWKPWVHMSGFALYAWLLTYVLAWTGKSALALCLYVAAMGMHLFPVACGLSHEYKTVYDRRGAVLLALASLTGWACGVVLTVPRTVLVMLVAVVAGGVIVNAMIAELPKEKEGRFGSFLAGAAVYAALLLTLSHFEKGA